MVLYSCAVYAYKTYIAWTSRKVTFTYSLSHCNISYRHIYWWNKMSPRSSNSWKRGKRERERERAIGIFFKNIHLYNTWRIVHKNTTSKRDIADEYACVKKSDTSPCWMAFEKWEVEWEMLDWDIKRRERNKTTRGQFKVSPPANITRDCWLVRMCHLGKVTTAVSTSNAYHSPTAGLDVLIGVVLHHWNSVRVRLSRSRAIEISYYVTVK